MRTPSRRVRAMVLTVCLAAAIVFLYQSLHGPISNRLVGILAPLASLGMIRLLLVLRIIELPPGFSMGFINRKPRFVEFAKALACFLVAAAWTVVGVRVVNNTQLGAAELVVPPVFLLIAMGVFIVRGLLLK